MPRNQISVPSPQSTWGQAAKGDTVYLQNSFSYNACFPYLYSFMYVCVLKFRNINLSTIKTIYVTSMVLLCFTSRWHHEHSNMSVNCTHISNMRDTFLHKDCAHMLYGKHHFFILAEHQIVLLEECEGAAHNNVILY